MATQRASQTCQPKAMAATLFPTGRTRLSAYGTFAKCARTQSMKTSSTVIMASAATTIGIHPRFHLFFACVSHCHRHRTYFRYGQYPRPKHLAHPLDCSVMTYRGHAVLQTLIRCHFSPSETTGGRYIYSGSADGRIHVRALPPRCGGVYYFPTPLTLFCGLFRFGPSTAGWSRSWTGARHFPCRSTRPRPK